VERLGAADLRLLLHCVNEIHGGAGRGADLAAFPHNVLDAVGQIVPGDYLAFSEANLARKRVVEVMTPAGSHRPDLVPALEAHMDEHVLIRRYRSTRDGRAYKISDFSSRADFHDSAVYQEVYRHYRAEDQLAIALPAPASLSVWVVVSRRRRSFTERDRLALNLVRPHLLRAYRNAEALTDLAADLAAARGALEATRQAVVLLAPDGGARDMTAPARRLLQEFFPACGRAPRLPEDVERWLEHEGRAADATPDDAPPPPQPLVVRRGSRRLVVRRLPAPAGLGGQLLHLQEAGAGAVAAPGDGASEETARRMASLPPRVRKVLDRLLVGDSEKEAAAALRLSRGTVHQYVKVLYRRLEVESRAELLARFIARL
jgi:DNA-binding CsgD family transcriptional regulator